MTTAWGRQACCAMVWGTLAVLHASGFAGAEDLRASLPPSTRPADVRDFVSKQDPAVPAVQLTNDGAVSPKFMQSHERALARGRSGPVGVLFIGDSLTGWPKDVAEKHFDRYQPATFANGGQMTQHVLWRIANGELDGIRSKVVVVLIGTNNLPPPQPPSEAARGVAAVVSAIRAKLPDSKVLLLGLLPRGPTPDDYFRKRAAEANQAIASLHDGSSVHYLDIGQHFLRPDGSLSSAVKPDRLHLTHEGYVVWAEAIAPVVEKLMGDGP